MVLHTCVWSLDLQNGSAVHVRNIDPLHHRNKRQVITFHYRSFQRALKRHFGQLRWTSSSILTQDSQVRLMSNKKSRQGTKHPHTKEPFSRPLRRRRFKKPIASTSYLKVNVQRPYSWLTRSWKPRFPVHFQNSEHLTTTSFQTQNKRSKHKATPSSQLQALND